MFEPCEVCGAKWWDRHNMLCRKAAEKFLSNLAEDLRATSDDNPRCPKCGMGDHEWTYDVPRHFGDGCEYTATCPHCEHEYPVMVTVTYHFRVEKSADNAGSES